MEREQARQQNMLARIRLSNELRLNAMLKKEEVRKSALFNPLKKLKYESDMYSATLQDLSRTAVITMLDGTKKLRTQKNPRTGKDELTPDARKYEEYMKRLIDLTDQINELAGSEDEAK